ncbi:hypothetical protein J4209_01230 [Candidatus Woesearchaeota archaeon]|nr:hypothetical protein [Candidatus Woesearchaeota archaeon]
MKKSIETKIKAKLIRTIILVFVSLLFSKIVYAASYISNQDHGGADWTLANGDYIAGTHTNIGTFTVPAGATVYVQRYNGASYGSVVINANNINVIGTIDASGAGYGGGGGGGGGSGSEADIENRPDPGPGGSGGAGTAGGSSGSSGNPGTSSAGPGGAGGAGGSGGGLYGGSGGGSGGLGGIGGYAVSQGQGDSSIDESLNIGSGGGGGGGGNGQGNQGCCNHGGGGGGGGGAGNYGGGYVKLYATNNLVVSGIIYTKGISSSTGSGSNGGCGCQDWNCPSGSNGPGGSGGPASSSSSSLGGSGGNAGACNGPGSGSAGGSGGAGAGGGVLLKAYDVTVSGTIDTRGGGNNQANGGTLKIFYNCDYTSGSYYTGRTYSAPFGACYQDIGLKIFDGTQTVKIAAEPLGTVTSPLRIAKAGAIYGIMLVDPSDAKASKIRIQTNNGIKALRKID